MELQVFLILVIIFYFLLSYGYMMVEIGLQREDNIGWVLFIAIYNFVFCMFLFPLFLGIKIGKKLKF